MDKKKYINSVIKKIKATDKTKDRIRRDLETEFESREENGESTQSIIEDKGTPSVVAQKFNAEYKNSASIKQYYIQKGLKVAIGLFTMFSLCITGISVFMGKLINASAISVIGGNDGPTEIYVIADIPDMLGFNNVLTLIGVILLAASIICAVTLFILRKRK